MNEPKPFASLSPSLLARKGGARPAMRSQLQPQWPTPPQSHEATARQIEDDLGWNDMGYDHGRHETPAAAPAPKPQAAAQAPVREAEVVAIKRAASLLPPKAPEPGPSAPEAPETLECRVPEVVRQRSAIAARVAEIESTASNDASDASGNSRRSALSDGRRAAFTLRLDSERHLKLRLACTIANRSAQQIVTDALDQFIATLPEVASLAAQLKKRG